MYSKQKSTMNALDYAAHTDSLAKIANRQGCDEIIDKYIDQDLPENMACIMFLLSSLNDVNKKYTRMDGNKQIRNFSIILKLASIDRCFVGRNGGNVFMAIFENTSKESIDEFLDRILKKVMDHNYDKKNLPMYYKYGLAYHEGDDIKNITELVSLSSKRAQAAEAVPEDLSSVILNSKYEPSESGEGYVPVVSVENTPGLTTIKSLSDNSLEKTEEEKNIEIDHAEERILSELDENLKKNEEHSEENEGKTLTESDFLSDSLNSVYKYSVDELEKVYSYDFSEVEAAVDQIA